MITDTDRDALLNPRPCGECGTIHGFHEYAECRKALRARIAELENALHELCLYRRADGDCWCNSPGAHSPGCLAARAAMRKR